MTMKRLRLLRCLKQVLPFNIFSQVIKYTKHSIIQSLIISLSLTACDKPDSLKDVDGNVYRTVKIGNQIWMAENLKVTHFNNGNPIKQIDSNDAWKNATTSAYCFYNNDKKNGEIYGPIYNWYTVNDVRRLAPKGWHIPTKPELDTLLKNCPGSDTLAADFLKEPGYKHWLPGVGKAIKTTGFDALPAGYRHKDGSFHNLKSNTYFWTENLTFEFYNWSPRIFYGFADVNREKYYQQYGFSVRCIKD